MKKIFTLLASMALLTGANAKTVPVSVIGKPSRAEAVTLAGKMRSLPSLVKKSKIRRNRRKCGIYSRQGETAICLYSHSSRIPICRRRILRTGSAV